MRILVPFGTRPEIIKLAPVVAALRERGCCVRAIATGQHFDRDLAGVFFEQLNLEPDAVWTLPDDEDERLGRLLSLASSEIRAWSPDLVLVLGDTYTVPLFAFAARKHRVPVVHIEAGLRSFNETSIEEVDRKIAAATASLHLAPTELAAQLLRAEGVDPERIRVVGNPVLDALRLTGCERREQHERSGVVLTAHRATNVDDPARLARLVELASELARVCPPVVFPVHPRTRARLGVAGTRELAAVEGMRVLEPVAYDEMLRLVSRAEVVVTDSGGIQEEASWLGVPVVVLRSSTPRWEGVLDRTSALVGMDVERALDAVHRFRRPDEQARVASTPCPYGDGHASEHIAAVLTDPATRSMLTLTEPNIDTPPAAVRSVLAGALG